MLLRSEKVPRPADLKILLGNGESVVGGGKGGQPPIRFLRLRIGNGNAVGCLSRPADPAAQLVQLREAESIRMLDHHEVRVLDIDPDLDHRRGNKQAHVSTQEFIHHAVALVRLQPAMNESDASF